MRILLVSHLALPHIGGIETAIHQYATQLADDGHEVVHASGLSEGDFERDAAMNRRYRFLRLPVWNPLEARFGVPYPFHPPGKLASILRREVALADVVHAHGMLQQASFTALLIASHKPRVLTEHVAHVAYSNPIINTAEHIAIATIGRTSARRAGAIVTYNTRVTVEMQRLAPRVPQFHIDNGVDAARFRPPSADERAALRAQRGWDAEPRVLFVGRLVEKKGAALAIEAAVAGKFKLVLAGPGNAPRAAASNSNIEILGPVDPDAMPDLYRAADVFLLPSHGEGFPLTAQEAMASGLPIVLGADAGYRATLQGAEGAARLTALDVRSIAAAVNDLLANRATAGREAVRFALSRFSWAEAARKHLEIYERLRAAKP